MRSAARLEIAPLVALDHERLRARVVGLRPGARVHLRASAWLGAQVGIWTSEAGFVADSDRLDLDQVAPLHGSYAQADALGLLWSLAPSTDPGPRLDTPPPRSAEHWTLRIAGEVDGIALAPVDVIRRTRGAGVTRQKVQDGAIRASLYRPAGSGPFPVVLVLGGSGGGRNESRAALLAAHGYAGVALAYFGEPDLPHSLLSIPLEHFERARTWLQAQPDLRAERLAVIGASRGGELALLLGATYPWVSAVIALVPSGIVWGGVDRQRGPVDEPAWTFRGKPLPFARTSRRPAPAPTAGASPMISRFLQSVQEAGAAAQIAVERTAGPILLLSAGDDGIWPSRELAELALRRMHAHGLAQRAEHVCYEGAGHRFGIPHLPRTIRSASVPGSRVQLSLGGSAFADGRAAEDAWRRTLGVLASLP